jgi:hypothetical protein
MHPNPTKYTKAPKGIDQTQEGALIVALSEAFSATPLEFRDRYMKDLGFLRKRNAASMKLISDEEFEATLSRIRGEMPYFLKFLRDYPLGCVTIVPTA